MNDGEPRERIADLVLIGSGLSATSTLISLLGAAGVGGLDIAMIDPVVDIGGVAYGARSGSTGLIITDLDDFLPEPDRGEFIEWLRVNLHRVEELESPPGPFKAVRESWISRNRVLVDADTWGQMFFPRQLFGLYLTELLHTALASSNSTLDRIEASVDHISRSETGDEGAIFDLGCSNGHSIAARNVVLATGAGPNRRLWPDTDCPAVIGDLYRPGLNDTLKTIADASVKRQSTLDILAIGANAATMELIYHLARSALDDFKLTTLAPSGSLPFLHPDGSEPTDWSPQPMLDLLPADAGLTSDAVVSSVVDATVEAEASGLSRSQSLGPIQAALGAVVAELPPSELQRFVTSGGTEIGRIHRRAGPECSNAASMLTEMGRLELIEGRFSTLAASPGDRISVEWSLGDGGTGGSDFDVVINCSGTATLGEPELAPLEAGLLEAGLIVANESGRGIVVNERLEASPGLFVVGPALAGNIIAGVPTWHTEHCGRLLGLSRKLAAELDRRLSSGNGRGRQ